MIKLEKIIGELILIGLQIYLDIAVFGPLIDEVVESGVGTLNSQGNPMLPIIFLSVFNIIAIIGWIDLIREVYITFKNNI